MPRISAIIVPGLLAWFVASSLWIYPHSLSYFNESVGGPLNGPNHLLGSNVDWGQDVRYLHCWLERHAPASQHNVRYFGSSGLPYFDGKRGISKESQPSAERAGNNFDFLASSVNSFAPFTLQGPNSRSVSRDQLPDDLREVLTRSTARVRIAYTMHVCPLGEFAHEE